MRLLELQFWQFGVTCSNLLQIHRPPTHIPHLNKIHHSFCSFYNKIATKKFTKLYFLKCYRVPAIFLIAFTRAFAKYTPYIHLSSHLIFYPSLHPSYLRKHQNGSQQITVSRTRRPSQNQMTVARLDDRYQNQTTVARTRRRPFERPASEHHERFNRSIKLNQSLDISPLPN